jgi:hypothetical protein
MEAEPQAICVTSSERQSLSAHHSGAAASTDTFFDMHDQEEVLTEFGKRIQRCYGCFIAYHLKDMYLGEDVTFFCEHCKDETMFHFDQFSQLMDISKLKEVADEHHH